MARIKIRAYNAYNQTIIPHEQIMADSIVAIKLFPCRREDHYPDVQNNLTLLQSTGMTDKNGKDIYEGDIIQFSSNSILRIWNGEGLKTRKAAVSWNQNKLCWWVSNGAEIDFQPDMETDDGKFEVIGNIYQHPDRLPY